ncbi:MAG: serine/threonine-protein kinase [Byssovorax sp.]
MSKSPPDAVEAGTILAGRYRVVRPLGKGGMGAVYLVQHLHTDQQLALKVLHATVVNDELALTRFRREARAPARVNSDHVVQVTDADVAPELGGVPFLVMEWLRGRDLEELAAGRTGLPAADVVLYLRQVARALDKAHVLGIIHRDLKPENLFLTTRDDGTPCVKILDFGIAKLKETGDEGANFKATGTGQIFGTPLYMSPEQTTAELDKVGPQTDIWALGIIAHRLLTGTEPWNAPTLTALISQIAFLPLPVPSQHGHDLGPGFDAWFARCCAREPLERFPTAGEAIAELARAVGVSEESGRMSVPSASQSTVVRPPRDDSARTAFSATAPAPSAITADPGETAPPRGPPPSIKLMLLGAGLTIALGVGGIVAYASSRPSPTAIAPPDATAIHAAVPSAAPITVVTPAPVAPVASAAPSASAPPDPKRPPPIHVVAPEPPTTVHHVPTTPPPPTVVPPPPATTAPTAPTAPPPPPDPLGTRH